MDGRKVWATATACVTGSYHLAHGIPCQDAVGAGTEPLPFVVVADGRGSAPVSERGARAAVLTFQECLRANQEGISSLLGDGCPKRSQRLRAWREVVEGTVMPSLCQSLVGLAANEGRAAADYEHTFAAAIVGPRFVGWLQVGDSGLVAVTGRKARLVAPFQRGEYANETVFVSAEHPAVPACGVLARGTMKGIFAFTDGVLPRLFDLKTDTPGPAFPQMATLLCQGKWNEGELQGLLQHPSWRQVGQDDRSLAALYRRRAG